MHKQNVFLSNMPPNCYSSTNKHVQEKKKADNIRQKNVKNKFK